MPAGYDTGDVAHLRAAADALRKAADDLTVGSQALQNNAGDDLGSRDLTSAVHEVFSGQSHQLEDVLRHVGDAGQTIHAALAQYHERESGVIDDVREAEGHLDD